MLIRDKERGISYCHWQAPVSCKAVAVMVHGLGGHSQRWEACALFLQSQGIASYALELQGFGETDGLPGHVDSFRTYYRDIAALREVASRKYPAAKVFILGESLGGLLAFTMAAAVPGSFSGVVCIAPAFKTKMPFSLLRRLQIFCALLSRPRMRFRVPLESEMCTRDREYLARMQADPREHRLASAKLLYATLRAQSAARRLRLKMPVLFMLPGADTVIDSEGSRRIFDRLKATDKILYEYPGMLHAIPIDTGKEKPFGDIAAWMRSRI